MSSTVRRRRRIGCSVLYLLLSVIKCRGAYPFGTNGGYDNEGGKDPICWDSTIAFNSGMRDIPNTTAEKDANFAILNDYMFDESQNVSVTLQSSCQVGTSLTVTPSMDNYDGRLLTTLPHSFQFDLQVTEQQQDASLGTTAWVRMLLCDAIQTGFCTPFVEQGDVRNSGVTSVAENLSLVAISDGLHLFTPFVRVELNETAPGVYNTTFDLSFIVPAGKGGVYFFIGHAVLFYDQSSNADLAVHHRLDIADAVSKNVVTFSDPPEILTVTRGFKIAVGIIIGVFLVGELYLLYEIVKNRSNPVMTLAQGPFLALLVVCGIIVTASSWVYLPVKDINCNLRGVLILIPLSCMAAILVGRLWRVYCTLSKALAIGSAKRKCKRNLAGRIMLDFLSCLANSHLLFKGQLPFRKQNSLRTTITYADLARVVLFLTLPQIVLQVVAICLYQRDVVLEFNQSGTVGRQVCEPATRWPFYAGIAYIGFLFIMAVTVAWVSRDLPSVFNEKAAIFKTAFINAAITFLILALTLILDMPSIHPNLTAALGIFMTLGVVLSTLYLIVFPKIKRLWSGERVVMSKLLQPARRGSSEVYKSLPPKTNGTSTAAQKCEEENMPSADPPIILRKDDPPPRRVEAQMLSVKDVIAEMSSNSLEGHHITLEAWQQLISSIGKLQRDLDRMEFMWSEEDEEANVDEQQRNGDEHV